MQNHPNYCSQCLFQAESECSGCVQKAVEADESNPEAWQTKARLHLVKSEFEESKSSISQSLGLWLPRYTAGVLVGLGKTQNNLLGTKNYEKYKKNIST